MECKILRGAGPAGSDILVRSPLRRNSNEGHRVSSQSERRDPRAPSSGDATALSGSRRALATGRPVCQGMGTRWRYTANEASAVSYTHLRAHETGRNLVCRLLLE